jgi:hypothetical protein
VFRDAIESVVGVALDDLAGGGDGVQAAVRVVVVVRGRATGGGGEEAVAVVVVRRRGALDGLGDDVVVRVVNVAFGFGVIAGFGDLGDSAAEFGDTRL